MTKQTKYVAFCSPKGGVGKSTFTIVCASYLHYTKGLSVAVVDADYPQLSVFKTREREEKTMNEQVKYQQRIVDRFKADGKRIYPVIEATPETAIQAWEQFQTQDGREFDIVLFDLPGTINAEGVMETIVGLDHIFVPVTSDPMVMESTLSLMYVLVDSFIGKPTCRVKSAHLFWTMVDRRERTVFYDRYEELMKEYGMQRLETHIPDRKKFNKELSPVPSATYRTTVFAPDGRFVRESKIGALADEILAVIDER